MRYLIILALSAVANSVHSHHSPSFLRPSAYIAEDDDSLLHLSQSENNRLLIGVLTQPIDDGMRSKAPEALAGYKSFIQASYIQALEASGSRTIPLFFDTANLTEELAKLDHLNGVQYCGGDGSPEYLEFGRHVYDRVKEINDAGTTLPIWGTCLGMQYLSIYAADAGEKILTENAFDSNDANYPLEFLMPTNDIRMFEPLGNSAQRFTYRNLTYNHHHDGVRPEAFAEDKGLR